MAASSSGTPVKTTRRSRLALMRGRTARPCSGQARLRAQAKKGALHVLGDADRELRAGQVGRILLSGVAWVRLVRRTAKTAERTSSQGYALLMVACLKATSRLLL